MNVSDALNSRISVRAFLDTPVPGELVKDILLTASRSPSGGNLQPWHVWALGGQELERFKALIAERIKISPMGEEPEYSIYPDELKEPYKTRRLKNGEDLYRAIGIQREDKSARLKQLANNFVFFGAPVGLFFAIDRQMGPGQRAELGMYMQSIMLLALEKGLSTCPQAAWALWHKTIGEFIGLPSHLMLVCGMAVGYKDSKHPINNLRTDRADLSEFVTMRGF